jgi:HEAT repeat protein
MCKDLTVIVHFMSLIALIIGLAQAEHLRIGTIEFFGTSGIDLQRVRSVLPMHEQDPLTEEQMPAIRSLLSKAIENAIGHAPTDISVVCCNEQQNLMVYVGLGGDNTAKIPFLPTPKGSNCLPRQGVHLYDQTMDAVQEAAKKGDVGEDDSHGYSLAHNPTLRAKQLAMRQYAVTSVGSVELALRDCGNPEHRRAAAEILGYATHSETQIKELVRASRDADDQVRNNAIRALWVLATSSRKTAARVVPADQFIEMLNSGIWEDRNKVGQLLVVLTASRSPHLLARLRTVSYL